MIDKKTREEWRKDFELGEGAQSISLKRWRERSISLLDALAEQEEELLSIWNLKVFLPKHPGERLPIDTHLISELEAKLKSAEELIAKKDNKIKETMEVKCYACDGDDKYEECTCLEIYDQRDKLLGEALALTLKDDPKLLVENTRSPLAKRTEGWITFVKDGE